MWAAKQVRIFFSKHNQLAFGLKMGLKIKAIRQRLDAIAADRTEFHFTEQLTQTVDYLIRERENTHSFVREEEVIGRDDENNAVIDLLLDTNVKDNVSIIAIVGIGGLGKTTLSQSVYNDKNIEENFELRMWVCVSEPFDVKVIVEKIIESTTKERAGELQMDSLQHKLRREVEGRKYLLVLDDVWNESSERWSNLKMLLMGGARGSKIVITTRSKLVAETAGATSQFTLKGLSARNSWLLFKQMAFKAGGEEPESPSLIKIGEEIVEKCNGVPLAIKTTGRLLRFKTPENDWLSFKDNELAKINQQENDIMQILKLSYKHLPSHLKQFFAYCSLFPKDVVIEKEELIRLWVSQGFVQTQCSNKPIGDVGHDFFMALLWRSFFQYVEEDEYGAIIRCKMHDLIHDMAQLVAGSECVIGDLNVERINEND